MPEKTEILNIRISQTQKATLDKLKGYNVVVSKFIRNAIKEKLKRDYPKIIEEFEKSKLNLPF